MAQDTDLRSELSAMSAKLDRLTSLVEKLGADAKQDGKWRMIFRRQLTALIRAHYLTTDLTAPNALQGRRFRLRSQNEEDGVILALLQAAGVSTRRFVEIGSGGTGGNSATLAYELGWSGVMLDASGVAVRAALEQFRANPGVMVQRKMVTSDGINELLGNLGVAGDVDFLSIDIDGPDYWLLDALTVTRSRVLVMEYNALFGPERAVTVPDATPAKGTPKGYAGASLAALEKCARRKGYRLVLCEDAGVNAFFVRDDLAPQVPTLTAAQAWRPRASRYSVDDAPIVRDVFAEIAAQGLPLVEV